MKINEFFKLKHLSPEIASKFNKDDKQSIIFQGGGKSVVGKSQIGKSSGDLSLNKRLDELTQTHQLVIDQTNTIKEENED